MQYTDTHTHLYMTDAYGDECDVVVRRAVDAGVTKLIFPDVSSDVRNSMFDLAARHPGIAYPCIGLHPTEIGESWRDEIDSMLALKDTPGLVAIGETGMDCHWSRDNISLQEEVFRIQLDLAVEKNLPVIIHNREATELVFKVLEGYKGRGLRGVFHAFSGSYETFCELDKYGDFYVGIGGVITFKKASIAETIKRIPLKRILTETDAPWLTPVPFRGERNESSYIPYIVEKIAIQKETDPETVSEAAWENALALFGL